MISGNKEDYEDWPELQISRPSAGGVIKTSLGKIIAYILPDGSRQFMPGMSDEKVASWQVFGISDPVEIKVMEDKIRKIVDKMSIHMKLG